MKYREIHKTGEGTCEQWTGGIDENGSTFGTN